MVSDYLAANSTYWSQGVYDNANVDTYVFKIYGRILKHQFGIHGDKRERLLDFGCGSGGNSLFFHHRNFDVYGVDQSEIDIQRCKARLGDVLERFKVISPQSLASDDWFPGIKFKIILAAQSLYYLSDSDLHKRLLSFRKMLEPGGILIATMMHESCWYYGMSEPAHDGLRFVRFFRELDVGRPNLIVNDHYINFTRDEADLREKFKLFTPIHSSGYYDGVYRDDEGSEKHLVFIGQNPD